MPTPMVNPFKISARQFIQIAELWLKSSHNQSLAEYLFGIANNHRKTFLHHILSNLRHGSEDKTWKFEWGAIENEVDESLFPIISLDSSPANINLDIGPFYYNVIPQQY